MAKWIGSAVSIELSGDYGTYQGKIKAASNETLTLTKAFHNGFPCETEDVHICAKQIAELKLIDGPDRMPDGMSTVTTIARPVAKRAGGGGGRGGHNDTRLNMNASYTNAWTSSAHSGNLSHVTISNGPGRSKPIDVDYRSTPNRRANHSRNGGPNGRRESGNNIRYWKDEQCFGSPIDSIGNDFDFEKNLALFDKEALWNELNNMQKPDFMRQADTHHHHHQHNHQYKKLCANATSTISKYRHDENVIAKMPTVYRQIVVPGADADANEYVTDDGLIVPSVKQSTLTKLMNAADACGLTWERRVELIGRAATEMTLHLVGGGHRMNPRNTHQRPTVVALCGPHRQGAMGLNAARQLSSQGVDTLAYVPNGDSEFLKQELALYTLSGNALITSATALPAIADLIIVALADGTDNRDSIIVKVVSDWIRENRAPVLALDPPASGTPRINAKFSLVPVLPLSHAPANGKIYLCNLGFPAHFFEKLEIEYQSPFGPKFVIPLHPKDI